MSDSFHVEKYLKTRFFSSTVASIFTSLILKTDYLILKGQLYETVDLAYFREYYLYVRLTQSQSRGG